MYQRISAIIRRIKPQRPAPDDWRAIQARYHRHTVYRALLGAFTLGLAGWLLVTKGATPTQSDIDAQTLRSRKTARPFVAPHRVDPSLLSTIDMALVHGELLPTWIISLQHSPHSLGHRAAEDAFFALRNEAGKDPNLGILLDRLHAKLMDGTYDFQGEIPMLIRGWNDYLARSNVPFRLEHRIDRTSRGAELRVRSYRVIAEVPIATNATNATKHLLLLTRQDRTNLIEAFLGQTLADRSTALVMTDRIAEYAVDRLWPLFDPEDGRLGASLDLGVAPTTDLNRKVRQEARRALENSVVETLATGFSVRRSLEIELSSLAQRRGCGSGILIERVPWNGLSDRALAMVNRVAKKNEQRHCPRVTLSDVRRISESSQQLRENAELSLALGALAGWFAKAVVAHEARHLADSTVGINTGGPCLCRGCPASFDDRAQAEVSAYLASFATQGSGYVALLQACGNEADRRGSHSSALEFLLPRLLVDGCTGAIPEDLYARAAALRAQLFTTSAAIEIPTNFPSVLPIPD